MKGILEQIGGSCLYTTEQAGRMGLFLLSTIAAVRVLPRQFQATVRQIHFIGARSLLLILVAGTFTGMVVALQFHDTLVRFGSVDLLGSAVALSIVRELGPVLTALMVIGRAGSAICAEIGIMRTEQQIDSLECMAIDPYRYLMAPRLLAGIISVPVLTCIFDVISIIGGYFVGVILFGVSAGAYFQGMYDSILWSDIEMGLVKSFVFGLVIVWISASKGYFMHLDRQGAFGAEGVSRTTTNAVVLSSIAVLFSDYLISAFMV